MRGIREFVSQVRKKKVSYLFLMPALGIAFVISVYPIIFSIVVSMRDTSYLQILEFVGLRNYLKVFRDVDVWYSVLVSVKYIFGTLAISIPLGLGLALALGRIPQFRVVFRTILIIPWVVSQVATALLWAWLLEPTYGPVSFLLGELGLSKIFFLGNPKWALLTLTVTNSWMSFPFAMVLLLAAIETVPKFLYEAAWLDGAKRLTSFFHITLPYILNTLLITIIMLTLRAFNMVTLIFIMTGGGPIGTTNTLSHMIFREAFFNFRIATASVLAVLMFGLNIVFSIAYIAVFKREANY